MIKLTRTRRFNELYEYIKTRVEIENADPYQLLELYLEFSQSDSSYELTLKACIRYIADNLDK